MASPQSTPHDTLSKHGTELAWTRVRGDRLHSPDCWTAATADGEYRLVIVAQEGEGQHVLYGDWPATQLAADVIDHGTRMGAHETPEDAKAWAREWSGGNGA